MFDVEKVHALVGENGAGKIHVDEGSQWGSTKRQRTVIIYKGEEIGAEAARRTRRSAESA
jgi:ABC-type uncharacterized transport system ATPase subunit